MIDKHIRALYDVVYDVAFDGEFEQPKLHILENIFLGGRAWFNSVRGCIGAEIFICREGQEDLADLVDSIVHEYCHAMQSVRGEKLSHGKKFRRDFYEACEKVAAYFNAGG